MDNSEFEDCLEASVYKEKIDDVFGVNLNHPKFRNNSKWSDRIKNVFMTEGKPWNERIEHDVKRVVSECVAKNPETSLNIHKKHSLDALVLALENLVTTV